MVSPYQRALRGPGPRVVLQRQACCSRKGLDSRKEDGYPGQGMDSGDQTRAEFPSIGGLSVDTDAKDEECSTLPDTFASDVNRRIC